MRKSETIYREILYQAIEKRNHRLTQSELAKSLNVSLSIVNSSVKILHNMGAVEIKQRHFQILDIKKILYYWASIRNLQKDIIYKTRAEMPITQIEKSMPNDIIFTAYGGYKFLFKDVPADYSEVYIYGDVDIKKRFPLEKGTPNLFVLKKDSIIERYGKHTTIANTFVDLWNLREWYAKEFVKALEVRLHGILE